MLTRLIALSLKQRLLVILLMLALVIAGGMAFRNLPIDAFPDVSTTQVKIIFKAPGMTPEEARYAAQRQFGNVASIQQRAREGRGV